MVALRTACWVETNSRGDAFEKFNLRHWLRVDPPAHAWLADDGDHDVLDQRGHLHTAPNWDKCSLYPHETPWDPEVLRFCVVPWAEYSAASGFEPPDPDEWERGLDSIGGRDAVRFHRRYPNGAYYSELAIWMDPRTGLLLRIESRDFDSNAGQIVLERIQCDYEYNIDIPSGVFDLPPPDKPLVVENLGYRDVTGELSPEVLAELSAVIDKSNAALIACDFAAFCDTWWFLDASKNTALPTRPEWERRVQSHAGLWERWETEFITVAESDRFPVAVASCVFQPVNDMPGTLWVTCALKALPVGSADWWQIETTYYLGKHEDRYRIVHWDYPSESLAAILAQGKTHKSLEAS